MMIVGEWSAECARSIVQRVSVVKNLGSECTNVFSLCQPLKSIRCRRMNLIWLAYDSIWQEVWELEACQ